MIFSAAIKSSVQWIIYPLIMLSALIGYLFLISIYPDVIWLAYIPILVAAICITGLEKLTPYNCNWCPSRDVIKTDILYMLFIQVSIPLLIGLGLVSFLSTPLSNYGAALSGWWPQHWSLVTQAALMLLVAELFSYWLHRAAHTIPVLWRFHAIHHSPEKLYWLNVGRFHPFEKVLQYLVSTFPFMLLGVSPEVIGLYFVFYATNGFLQHSNIKLKFGILNFLVSSAALHRWHHSLVVQESNHNYGNNLIVWDLIFGSRFLPKDREILNVGSGIDDFPCSFIKQITKPFKRNTSTQNRSVRNSMKKMFTKIIAKYIYYINWRPFINRATEPMLHQRKILNKILNNNAKTRFGRIHGFSATKQESKFKINVPISKYEDIESLINDQSVTSKPILYNDKALFYARTSGTTGRPKDIPITSEALSHFKLQQRLMTSYQFQLCPEAFSGKALGIVSPAVEGQREDGLSYGSVSGYVYKTMPAFICSRYVVPAEVFEISDYDLKYRVIIRLALADKDITYLGSANPSTFLRLRQMLTDEWDNFLTSLKTGELDGTETLPASLQEILKEKIKPEPGRYSKLKKLRYSEYREYKDVWPSIRMVTTWTAGNCQLALNQLIDSFPKETKIIELGYVASELRCTLTCDPVNNAGLPMLEQVYYEFIEKEEWDTGQRDTLNIIQLEQGKRYYVIVTTNYGLYRYFMNDLVEVCGKYLNTPLLKFSQKGNGVTNITGEKVYENQINEAIYTSCKEIDHEVRFNLSLANVVNAKYEIYLELKDPEQVNVYALSHAIDKSLAKINTEYREKRNSGRLAAPRVYLLSNNTSEAYKRFQIDRGQREGQYKLIGLLEKSECIFPIHDYLIEFGKGEQYA